MPLIHAYRVVQIRPTLDTSSTSSASIKLKDSKERGKRPQRTMACSKSSHYRTASAMCLENLPPPRRCTKLAFHYPSFTRLLPTYRYATPSCSYSNLRHDRVSSHRQRSEHLFNSETSVRAPGLCREYRDQEPRDQV